MRINPWEKEEVAEGGWIVTKGALIEKERLNAAREAEVSKRKENHMRVLETTWPRR